MKSQDLDSEALPNQTCQVRNARTPRLPAQGEEKNRAALAGNFDLKRTEYNSLGFNPPKACSVPNPDLNTFIKFLNTGYMCS